MTARLPSGSFWRSEATRSHQAWLIAILVVACLLRIAGSLYDRGTGFHPDERHYLDGALRMMREG
ncbi:MAG: hypothetical protein ACREIN_02815, partial [Candidatus Methylomirabilaceae bacterium]